MARPQDSPEKRYRAKLVRRCYIPKENGKERALGIPALEDRLLQLACAKILTSIFESDFTETSYGYRPNRSAQEAIEDLQFNLQFGKFGYIVEADIKGFFDNIDHDWLLRMLRERIDDAAFLNLIRKSFTWQVFNKAIGRLGIAKPKMQVVTVNIECLHKRTSYAEASTTEEPDAEKPHVLVCAGGAG